MTILEPMTLITDWMLAAQCLWLGSRLWRASRATAARSQGALAGALLSTALAAFVGGASHGFAAHLGSTVSWIVWKATVLAIGATTLLFLVTAALATLQGRRRGALLAFAGLQAVAYAGWMLTHDEFIWVIAHYVPAMCVVLVLMLVAWRRREPFAPWMVSGIVVAFVGAGIQALGLAPHPSFNHNDLYHAVQMAATWLLYRGGLSLRDRAEQPAR